MNVIDGLRDFIINEMQLKQGPEELTVDYPLVENGIIDSLGLFMLVSFIGERFGVEIGPDELNPQDFGTIGAMARLIERKRAVGTGAPAAGRD